MLAGIAPVLAADGFVRPEIDWHAAAPELTLLGFGALITMIDIGWLERARRIAAPLASLALLATMVPIITLALAGDDRSMFDGGFVVDDYSLIMKAMFVLAGYVVVLMSTNYIAEGDYWENEYYGLLLSSILGMILMASARDLISIFVALELLSIPAYMLATWRKRDLKSNEAGLKYYLMGVFASAVMLYGMSLLYGATGSTLLVEINDAVGEAARPSAIVVLGIIFVVVGFAFKVSAFPFHTWAPDTYEGSPTPVTAFISVASKAAGFVALLNLVFVGFVGRDGLVGRDDIFEPLMWVLAAASMTAGNLMALRQTNMVRLLAYSGVAQAGYMLAPLAVAGSVPDKALTASVTYLVIYAAMNLGAFAVVIAVARKTRSAEVSTYRGLFHYAPGLTVAMTIFLFSLAGIPPLGGWIAKFRVMEALIEAETSAGVVLGVFVAVNSVIALYYYARVGFGMWAEEAPDGDLTPVNVPLSLGVALTLTAAITIAMGVIPGDIVGRFTDVSLLAGG
ncbi:MAG: NADH-quinone oxidoreductase subunit N [Acidimicrobiaceae bacterium]|nr:NADH-quinone oxidoreductase subunit N [Acidimicrobiia bacterium]MCY4494830.1 NADH-quinone oxidoreductase subunit N [Acidimicrobiaceae bacterium]